MNRRSPFTPNQAVMCLYWKDLPSETVKMAVILELLGEALSSYCSGSCWHVPGVHNHASLLELCFTVSFCHLVEGSLLHLPPRICLSVRLSSSSCPTQSLHKPKCICAEELTAFKPKGKQQVQGKHCKVTGLKYQSNCKWK